MAKQINKIIFTTKEAYDQKVSEGTLDPSVVYAIDASQAVTNIEVKAAVDTGFEKFGLSLGIDEEKAKFYNINLSLADMIKDLVKEKFDANYSNDTRKLVSNGTRNITISDVKPNSVVTIRQNGVDLGMVKYDLTYSGLYHNAAINLPESVDLSTDFEVKLSNIFDTKSNTIIFVASLESIVKDALDNLSSDIDFDSPRVVSGSDYGSSGGSNYYISFYQDTVEGKNQFSSNYYELSGSRAVFVAIPDKSLIDTRVLNVLDNTVTEYSRYIVFTDLGLTEYYDSVAKTWKSMPQDKNEILVKLRTYTNYPFNSVSINNAKVTDILSKVNNLSDINTKSMKQLETAEISSTDEDVVANSEVLVYTNYSNAEGFIDSLITLNASKPLKVKAIKCLYANMTQSIIDKLASLPTLQLLVTRTLNDKKYFNIPENFKPLLIGSGMGENMYIEAVEGNGCYIEIPESVTSVIRKF